MWTSKIGNAAKPLLLGLSQSGTLLTFASLTGPGGSGAPQLRMRLRHQAAADAVSFDVVSYTDPDTPAQYNAQVNFTAAELDALPPGIYIAEIDAEIAGVAVTFPDDRHLLLRFLPSVD